MCILPRAVIRAPHARKRVRTLLLSFGLLGLLRQVRDAITCWLDRWVLQNRRTRCPRCLSPKLWRDGHDKRLMRCPVQRFVCAACGKSCCINTFAPWYWHKYDPSTILGFLWCKTKLGYGLIEAARHASLSVRFPTWKTLWSWLQKFGTTIVEKAGLIQKRVRRYRAWQTDEAYVRNMPIFGTVDPQTNTILFTPRWRADEKNMEQHLRTVLHHWKKRPRGWWTDEHKSHAPAFDKLPVAVPHGMVCHAEEYRSSKGVCTNAIENQWRQYRRWLFRINGIKHQAYVPFYTKLYEAQRNSINNPLVLLSLLR